MGFWYADMSFLYELTFFFAVGPKKEYNMVIQSMMMFSWVGGWGIREMMTLTMNS